MRTRRRQLVDPIRCGITASSEEGVRDWFLEIRFGVLVGQISAEQIKKWGRERMNGILRRKKWAAQRELIAEIEQWLVEAKKHT